jgi:hypothetical protein
MDVDPVELVIARERALLSAEVRRNPAALDELLDPEFREVGASGRLWTRTAMRAALADPEDGESPVQATDMHGQLLRPDLVLLTYLSDRAGRRARRSSLWRHSDARWRLLYHQGTPTDGA